MPWILPVISAAASGIQAISAAKKRKSAENALENMQTPTYAPNQSILDYYQKALNKYNTSPTETAEYKVNQQGIKQGVVQGLNSLQDRRSGLAGVPSLIAAQNNALLKSNVASEQRKAQDFNTLGRATEMKKGEDSKAYQQNFIAPFEKNYNLLAAKAAGQAQVENAAIQNAYNNASSAANFMGGGGNKDVVNFSKQYGKQAQGAYDWAKNHDMSFKNYRNTANRVGGVLSKYTYGL